MDGIPIYFWRNIDWQKNKESCKNLSHFSLVPKSEKPKRNGHTNQSEKRPLLRRNKTLQNTQTLRCFITEKKPCKLSGTKPDLHHRHLRQCPTQQRERSERWELATFADCCHPKRVLFSHQLNSVSWARKQPSHIRIKVLHFLHSRLVFAECFPPPLTQESAFFIPQHETHREVFYCSGRRWGSCCRQRSSCSQVRRTICPAGPGWSGSPRPIGRHHLADDTTL